MVIFILGLLAGIVFQPVAQAVIRRITHWLEPKMTLEEYQSNYNNHSVYSSLEMVREMQSNKIPYPSWKTVEIVHGSTPYNSISPVSAMVIWFIALHWGKTHHAEQLWPSIGYSAIKFHDYAVKNVG